MRRRRHHGEISGIIKLRVKRPVVANVVRLVKGVDARADKLLRAGHLVGALVHVHRGGKPLAVVADTRVVGIKVVRLDRRGVYPDRSHVPLAVRVARLREADQHRRLGRVHIRDGEQHPTLGQMVVYHLRIEHEAVIEASPKIAQAHLAQQLTLAGLHRDLGVQRHHQVLRANRTVRVRGDRRVIVNHAEKVIAHPRLEIAAQQARSFGHKLLLRLAAHFADTQQPMPPHRLVRPGIGRRHPVGHRGKINRVRSHQRIVLPETARGIIKPLRRRHRVAGQLLHAGWQRRQWRLAKLILRGHLLHLHPSDEPGVTGQQFRQLRVQVALGQAAGQRRHPVAVVGIDINRLCLRLANRRIHQQIEVTITIEVE